MHTTVKVRTFTVAKVQATPALKPEVLISSNSQRVAAATAQPGDAGLVWAPAAQPGDADLWGPAEAVVVAATLTAWGCTKGIKAVVVVRVPIGVVAFLCCRASTAAGEVPDQRCRIEIGC